MKTQVAAAAELGDVQAGRSVRPDDPPGEMGGKSPLKGGYVSFRGGKITCLGLVCLCFLLISVLEILQKKMEQTWSTYKSK